MRRNAARQEDVCANRAPLAHNGIAAHDGGTGINSDSVLYRGMPLVPAQKLAGRQRLRHQPPGSACARLVVGDVHAATGLAADPEGRCRHVRIALNGAANRPVRATEAEQLLEGARMAGSAGLLAEAADAAARQSEPLDEVFESSAYRREMVRVYVRRALERAWP